MSHAIIFIRLRVTTQNSLKYVYRQFLWYSCATEMVDTTKERNKCTPFIAYELPRKDDNPNSELQNY